MRMTQVLAIKFKEKVLCQKSERSVMKKKIAKKLSIVIVYIALFIIGILAIPVCVFLVPIVIVWTLADKIVRRLERE